MTSKDSEHNTISVHYNNQDIAQKAFQAQFKKGTKPLIGLGVDTEAVKRVLPTNIAKIETTDDEADFLFELEDGTLLHIEFQSTYDKWDVIRFARYHLHFYDTYKEKLETVELENKIRTVVIYSKKPEGERINHTINTGKLSFDMEAIHIRSLNGDECFEEIKNKIKSDPYVVLSLQEQQQLIYNPYMSQKSSVNDRTLEIAILLATLKDEEVKFRLIGTLAILTHKDLTEDTLNKIREVFEVGAVFEKFQRERDEKVREETFELTAKVIKMLKQNIDIEEIAEQTGFSIEKIMKIQQLTNS